MLALDIRQHQSARNPIEYLCRGRAAASLFQPCVPGGTYVRALRHFFAAQAGGAATFRRKAECCRIEFRSTVLQIGPKQGFSRDVAHPISNYTRIISLLYQDTIRPDTGLQRK